MGTTEGPQPKPGLADDPRALRALAHPTRLALLEILGTRDQATATQCAELLAQTVANCSFHLRTLASHGFIARVPGTTGKDRPWRALSTRQNIGEPSVALAGEASERESAVAEFERFFLANEFARFAERRLQQDDQPEPWRKAPALIASTVWLTAEELTALNADLEALALRYAHRRAEAGAIPDDARLVRLFFASSLVPPASSGGRRVQR